MLGLLLLVVATLGLEGGEELVGGRPQRRAVRCHRMCFDLRHGHRCPGDRLDNLFEIVTNLGRRTLGRLLQLIQQVVSIATIKLLTIVDSEGHRRKEGRRKEENKRTREQDHNNSKQ